jgi:pimeloyl-ACP methyl ester carboxylesterase
MKADAIVVPVPNKSTNVRLFRPIDLRQAAFQALAWLAPPVAARFAMKLFLAPPEPRPLSAKARALLASADDRFTVQLDTNFGQPETSRVHLWLWGRGPAVYFLHGWGGRGAQWISFVEPIVRAGFTAVALDAPAHGDSAAPRTSILHFAGALAAVSESVGPARAVIGHSLGGAAAALAIRQGMPAEKVVLIGSPANPAEYFDAFMHRLGIPERLHPRVRAEVEQGYGFAWSDLAVTPPRKAMFSGADIPALVVHDSQDAEVEPGNAARIADAWPGAEIMMTRGLGHQRVLRHASVVERVVGWLAEGAPAKEKAVLG